MKPAAAFCLALFGTMTLVAQTTTNQAGPLHVPPAPPAQTIYTYHSDTQKTTTIVVPLPQISSCPVSVRAQQSSAANPMEVDRSRPKGLAQLLHLTLADPSGGRVVKATVTVRGLLPKTRATLTPMTLGTDPSSASKTLEVAFPAGTERDTPADVWVPGLSAVYSIDLVSVTYADGSSWTANTSKACRTPIDGFMLVGAR
jgi:hypothetical protein